jgi:transposase
MPGGIVVNVPICCSACGVRIADAAMEEHRVGPELDGREFFCPACSEGLVIP